MYFNGAAFHRLFFAVAARLSRIAGGEDIGVLSDDECGAGRVDPTPGTSSVRRRRPALFSAANAGIETVGGDRSAQRAAASSLFPPFCSTPRVDVATGAPPAPQPLSRVPAAPADQMSGPSTSGGGQPRLPMVSKNPESNFE